MTLELYQNPVKMVGDVSTLGLKGHLCMLLYCWTDWSGLLQAGQYIPPFLFQESWFLFTLVLFMAGQSVLKYALLDNLAVEHDPILALRSFIYFFSMAQLTWTHRN